MKESVVKFKGGNAEEAIRHVRIFWLVEAKKGYKKEFSLAKQARTAQKDAKSAISDEDSDCESKRDTFDSKINECTCTMKSAREDFWQLFENLIAPGLVNDWQQIVAKETSTEGYVARNGIRKMGKRGKTNAALNACIRTWLLCVMKPNAAERHRNYLFTQIMMPMRGVPVKGFCLRVVEMNEYLVYMPCLRDLEGLPKELPRADVPFTPIMMCTLILNAVPWGLYSAYWAKHETNYFPTNVDELTEELVHMEPEFGRIQSLMDKVQLGNQNGKPKAGPGKSGGRNGSEQPIPRKGIESSKGKKAKKYCSRCAKGNPGAQFTHNTKDCKRFDKGGNNILDARDKARGVSRNSNAHVQEESDMKECFAQMLKGQEKLMKSFPRRRRRLRSAGSMIPRAPNLRIPIEKLGPTILVSIASVL